jgi:hypothetical protein
MNGKARLERKAHRRCTSRTAGATAMHHSFLGVKWLGSPAQCTFPVARHSGIPSRTGDCKKHTVIHLGEFADPCCMSCCEQSPCRVPSVELCLNAACLPVGGRRFWAQGPTQKVLRSNSWQETSVRVRRKTSTTGDLCARWAQQNGKQREIPRRRKRNLHRTTGQRNGANPMWQQSHHPQSRSLSLKALRRRPVYSRTRRSRSPEEAPAS